MRREGPVIVTTVLAVLYVLSYTFSVPALRATSDVLDTWFTIVKAMMCFMGAISLILVNGTSIARKRPDRFYGYVVLISLFGYMIIGFVDGLDGATFSALYNNVCSGITTSLFSSLTFWIGSAAYRAFRARNVEAAILLISAGIVMLGSVTLGQAITPALPKISQWILDIPNTAGMRAVGLGAAVGGIVLALRIVLGLERTYLGAE